MALVASAVVACGDSGSAPAQEVWTAKPGVAADVVDASVEAADAMEATDAKEPEGPLCELKGPPTSAPGDVLVYAQDFNTDALDPLEWNNATGYNGHGTVANTSAPANAVVRGGLLSIVSERNPTDTVHPYVSARIDTLGKFARTYGKIEFRARFPYAGGVWYAIWGRPWSQPFPEIDIEVVNRPEKASTELYFVNHWAAPPLPANDRRSYTMTDTLDVSVFHTYTVLWKPGSLEWQIDGVTKMAAQPRGVPDLPVYWIINGWVGGWPGAPTAATPFPATFDVDYMRVYRVDGVVADPVLKILNPRTKYARTDAIEVAIANFDEACANVEMYEGTTLLRATSTRPLRFAASRFAPGPHTITFVATDGVRKTTTTLETEVN
jgi:beta-glucanase (GH16 family)